MTPSDSNIQMSITDYCIINAISRGVGGTVFEAWGFFPNDVKTPSHNSYVKAFSYPVYVGQCP